MSDIEIKVVIGNPPNNIRESLDTLFPHDLTPIYTFGDTIYNPHQVDLTADLVAHERVHMAQQGNAPAKWWWDYIHDAEFRFKAELQAYHTQYLIAKNVIKDRNDLARYLHAIASDLSSPMYGELCSHSAALKHIRLGVV